MENNRIKLRLEGTEDEDGDVRVEVFISALESFKRALSETDRLVSGGNTSLYFRVSDLKHSSPATIEFEGVANSKDLEKRGIDLCPRILSRFRENFRVIQEEGVLPEYTNLRALNSYREFALLHDKGIARMSISGKDGEWMPIRRDTSYKIDEIIGPDQISIGSLTGYLHGVNIHEKNVMTIYPSLPGTPGVRCIFPNTLRRVVIDGLDRYVTVYGVKKIKALSTHPYEMKVSDIEIHPPVSELPTLGSLKGVAPNATGNLSSEEFVQEVRSGWR